MIRDKRIWRVDTYFSHLDKPVIYEENAGKIDAYECVKDMLMSENIERVLVYIDGKLYQTITVNTSTA